MVYVHPSSLTDEGDLHDGYRVCTSCTRRQHISEFHWAGKKTYRRRVCKTCDLERAKARREADRDNYRRKRNGWRIKKEYGLSLEDYDEMLTVQGEACKICKSKFDLEDQSRRPHVDHCHKTGKVRGILCMKCNTAIGKFNDDVVLLRSAIEYLKGIEDE